PVPVRPRLLRTLQRNLSFDAPAPVDAVGLLLRRHRASRVVPAAEELPPAAWRASFHLSSRGFAAAYVQRFAAIESPGRVADVGWEMFVAIRQRPREGLRKETR